MLKEKVRTALKEGQEFTPNQGAYRFSTTVKSLTSTISKLRTEGLNVHFVPRTNSYGDTYNKYSLRKAAKKRAA